MIDPRIERGTRAMLALRSAQLEDGASPLGWKLGFGAPAALQRLGTDRPLVGFLTDRTLLADRSTVDVDGWRAPMIEAEIAVRIRGDGEIAALAPAIEVVDIDPPPADVEAILACNIYHRRVLLGDFDESRTDAAGVTMRLLRDGDQVASSDAPEAATGVIADVVQLTGELLAACGERLRSGEVIITGSATPPLPVAAGEQIQAVLDPLGSLTVELGGGS